MARVLGWQGENHDVFFEIVAILYQFVMVVILHEAGMRSRAADLYRRRAPEAENGLAGELAVDFAASVPGSSRNHNPRRTVEFVLILFVPRITEFVCMLTSVLRSC
jgi:hypothetical protein